MRDGWVDCLVTTNVFFFFLYFFYFFYFFFGFPVYTLDFVQASFLFLPPWGMDISCIFLVVVILVVLLLYLYLES